MKEATLTMATDSQEQENENTTPSPTSDSPISDGENSAQNGFESLGELPPNPPSKLEELKAKVRVLLEKAQISVREFDAESTLARVQAFAQLIGSKLGKKGAIGLYGRIATVVLSTWFAAGGTAVFLEKYIPEPPRNGGSTHIRSSQLRRTNPEEMAVVWTRNLFNSKGLLPGDEDSTSGPSDPGGAPVKSTLPLNLIGTLVLRDELRSIATIEDKSASLVYPLRAEDEIPGKIRVIGVESRRVIFLNLSASRREFLELPADNTANARISLGAAAGNSKADGKSGVEQLSATQFNVSRVEIDAALGDLNKILTQARAVPNFENGQPSGYKLFQIVPGSIYDKLGLKNNDLLMGINGQPMNDPGKAFEMLSELKNQSHVELSVKRDGKVSNFAYEIR